jgi:hypothetical protein
MNDIMFISEQGMNTTILIKETCEANTFWIESTHKVKK